MQKQQRFFFRFFDLHHDCFEQDWKGRAYETVDQANAHARSVAEKSRRSSQVRGRILVVSDEHGQKVQTIKNLGSLFHCAALLPAPWQLPLHSTRMQSTRCGAARRAARPLGLSIPSRRKSTGAAPTSDRVRPMTSRVRTLKRPPLRIRGDRAATGRAKRRSRRLPRCRESLASRTTH